MRYHSALELFYLKAKEEFDKRAKKGSEMEGVQINYFGCGFTEGKIVLHGERIVYGNQYPLSGRFTEAHPWEEGVEVFQAIMKDIVE